MSRTFIHCKTLFTGLENEARREQTLIVENGLFTWVGGTADAPARAPGDALVDAGDDFVMPGLIDVHTHLVFGNAKSEEDIDLHVSPEFRALRGLFFTQHVMAAGYTSVVVPGDAGQCSIAVRNAINAGMFPGPRIAASSNVIANRQSLNDWFPSWVGTPEYFSGRLCATREEQIAEIRRQAKDGADVIKIAMDGTHRRDNGEIIAAFTEEETKVMVDEIHRLGKKVAVHAYGAEAVLYAAKAGVDVIFHAFFLDDACIEAMLASGSHLAPTLTMLANNVEFAELYEASTKSGYAAMQRRVIDVGCRNLRRARKAGVPFMTGSDSGFAITPYGEWHARELEIFVDWLGFTPAEALRAATSVAARMLPAVQRAGSIEVGRPADFLFIDGSPLQNVAILQERERIRAVFQGGRRMQTQVPGYDPNRVSDFNTVKWSELHTRQRAVELGKRPAPSASLNLVG
ncbi:MULTISPECIES: metal-dependent hydrolase family protein [Stutzerimonas]|uniref:metal-dependent hydrolase family protein n=1 Tax=Stutzerimonas TaxID=2901164 RepID=UPI00147DB219|nr:MULTISPECIES: amidohydrolase family protein [Stutzerimonas]WRQ02305.1 amidohydrolase family protein [Stutzerimonas stutzeri]